MDAFTDSCERSHGNTGAGHVSSKSAICARTSWTAARAAVQDVLAQIADFEETCPAPVFPCDLSQLSVKASTRVSGPLKRALPTLSEVRSGYTGSHTTAFAL